MKTRKNIFSVLLASLVATTFWSCDDEVEYTPAQESLVTETQVYFIDNGSSELIIGKDDTSFSVVLGRKDNSIAQNITLKVINPNDTVFTSVPTTVEFAVGESEKELVIQVSEKMKFFQSYPLEIVLPEEYVNPYIEQDNQSFVALNVSKEDYAPYAVGTYYSWWYDESWEHVMEYSEYLGRYRFADLWAEGYDVEFTWDGTTITCLNSKNPSGYIHPTYGMVTAEIQATKYNAEQNAFLFQYKWTVSAGSFGAGVDSFVITELK